MNWGFGLRRAGRRSVLRGAGLGVVGLVVGLLVPGCSDGGDGVGTVTPDVSASVVPTSVVSATPPALPRAKPTSASAVEFVRYFWDAYNYAYASYDTRPLSAISEPTCKYCSSTSDDIKKIQLARTQVEGYQVHVIEAASPPADITTGTVVIAACSQAPGKSVYPDGKSSPLKGFSASNFTFALRWANARWTVEGVDYGKK